jgi:hypothetical protein
LPRDHSQLQTQTPDLDSLHKNAMAEDQDHDADQDVTPSHTTLYRHAKDFALGEHPLAKYAPPVLLLLDALLCSLIISKVSCKLRPYVIEYNANT